MSELVSIIVPVYNLEEYLPRCLECLKAQTYTNLEIILVDDGSSDGSGRLCDEFTASDPRARVIHHPENKGLWAARNTGQEAAHGEYLWFPDGDDYFHRDIVKLMHQAINQTSSSGNKYDVAIVGHKDTARFDEDIVSERAPLYVEKKLDDVLEVLVRPHADFTGRNVWNKLCRRSFVADIRTGNYKYAQDCDFSIKLYKKYPAVVYIDNVLYYFVIRSTSVRFNPDYEITSNQCMAKIAFQHSLSKSQCRKYLLCFLYMSVAQWLDSAQGTNDIDSVRYECRAMIARTWKAYLCCRGINTPMKRLGRLLRVRFDRLYHFWK